MHKEIFMIYRRDAKKGEATYSPKSHSAPHFEGHYVEGMEEWASWYCFNKKDDGTYEAELDEAWNEGSHYGGGTINVDIPKEWFALSYDEFLLVHISLIYRHVYSSCCLGEIPTKYHITIQKTITEIKAIRKGVSESRPCFEKFTMP